MTKEIKPANYTLSGNRIVDEVTGMFAPFASPASAAAIYRALKEGRVLRRDIKWIETGK